jgi:hypothetical protein
LLGLLVLGFLAQRGWELWRTAPADAWRVEWAWLLLAGVCSVLAWGPSIWLWRALLGVCGPQPSWWSATRAYCIGGLGKYVPGKAMVLVMRAGLLQPDGVKPGVAAVTVTYETLAMMGAGLAIAVALAPQASSPTFWAALPESVQTLRNRPLLLPVLVAAATAASLPVLARLLTELARKLPAVAQGAEPNAVISTRLLGLGLVALSGGWCFAAVSLGCVLRALGHDFVWSDFPLWLAAITLSTVGGFVVLIAPGGLGVRELLLSEVLQSQPGISAATAFLAAWLLRASWLAAEVVVAAALYAWPRRSFQPVPRPVTPRAAAPAGTPIE